jgi:bifunctional non-homologous end joining protein LigD
MPLARFDVPFDHPDWIFEPKMDGFRAVAYIEGGACRLVSRPTRNAFKTFEALAQAIGQDLSGRAAILDGELPFLRRRGVRARRSIEAAVWQIDRNVDTQSL